MSANEIPQIPRIARGDLLTAQGQNEQIDAINMLATTIAAEKQPGSTNRGAPQSEGGGGGDTDVLTTAGDLLSYNGSVYVRVPPVQQALLHFNGTSVAWLVAPVFNEDKAQRVTTTVNVVVEDPLGTPTTARAPIERWDKTTLIEQTSGISITLAFDNT